MIYQVDPNSIFQQLDVDKSRYIDPVEFSNNVNLILNRMDLEKIDRVTHTQQSEHCAPYQPGNNIYGKHETTPWYGDESRWDPNNLWAKYSNQDYLGLMGTWKMSEAEFKQMMEDYGKAADQQPEQPRA
jgi:hypothetical protein